VHAPQVSQAEDAAEREADRMADAVVAGARPGAAETARPLLARAPAPAGGVIDGGATPVVAAGRGRALDPALRQSFEPRFGHDLSGLRVHDDAGASASCRSLGARAFALGNDLYFGRGQYAPATEDGRRLIAHEVAHTLQPHDPGRIARKTLTDLSQTIRANLMIARTAPAQADIDTWIKNYFNPTSGVSISAPIAAEFGTEITDTNQQKGLRSIATELANLSAVQITPATATTPEQRTNTDPENWPLPPNAILELALDLRTQGGDHAIYRFARYTSGSADTVLIEKTHVLAAAPAPGTTPSAPATQPAAGGTAPSFTGKVRAGSVDITIDSQFGDVRGKAIADAVQLLPDPIRAKVDGVSFEFAGSGKGPGGQNGQYQEIRDTVQIWGDMFDPSARRVGEATSTAYQVVHELGHVIDLRPEFKAQRDRDKADARRQQLERDLKTVDTKYIEKDPLGDPDKDPQVAAEKRKIQDEIIKARQDIAAANTAMASAKSVSGHELGPNTESLLTDFGRAIALDGVTAVTNAKARNKAVDAANAAGAQANPPTPARPHEKDLTKGVSNYAKTDLMEAFAENFSYYALDEATFRAIRPNTYAFFARAFPKTVSSTP
jgi:hypothetical protein